jgi:glycosyltransferase involved in cell wall biosynthesis
MKNPKVSILMSVYNGANFLPKSIESVLDQSFANFEFIIINDCSTDNSLEIIKNYQRKDKRIKIISNKKNLGLTRSLNKGLKTANGKHIARIDADDYCRQDRLQKQTNFLEKNKNIFLVASWVLIVGEDSSPIGIKKIPVNSLVIAKRLEKGNCLFHSSIMFRSHPFARYRNKFIYAQDYDFYLRLLSKNKKIAVIPEPLISYRTSDETISIQKKAQQDFFAQKAKEFHKQRKKTGKDKYPEFKIEKILKIKNNQPSLLKSKIIFMLQLGRFDEAKKIYPKYNKVERSFFTKIPLYIFINCPAIYKFYRFLRYGEK